MSRITACVLSFVVGIVLTLGATYKTPSTEAPEPAEKNQTCALPESFSEQLAECEYRLEDCVLVVNNFVEAFRECVDEVELAAKRLTDAVKVIKECMYHLNKCRTN